jgi:hypothetical protein
MIIKIEHFTNEKGCDLKERTLVSGDKKTEFDRFVGTVAVGIQTPMGPQLEHIDFPIAADNMYEAFEKFESSARAHLTRLKAELQREQSKKIALPNGPLPPMPGPGNPNGPRRIVLPGI